MAPPPAGSLLADGYAKLSSGELHIEYQDSSVTRSQADAVFQYFANAHTSLQNTGYRIGRVRFDLKSGRFEVGYSIQVTSADATVMPLTGSAVLTISPLRGLPGGKLEDVATTTLSSIVKNAVYKKEAPSIPFDRVSDTTPYFGGSRVHGPSGSMGGNNQAPHGFSVCTSGFAARSRTSSGAFLTVPYHCYKPANPVFYTQWTTSGNRALGNVSSSEVPNDTAFVKLGSSSTSSPYIFNGPWGNNTQAMKVVGSSAIVNGDEYCASGASSLNRCGGIVDSFRGTDVYENLYTGQEYSVWVYKVVSKSYTQYAAQGDSGGPVYKFSSASTVIATGLIVGGAEDILTTCQDSEPDPARPIICTTGAMVTPVQDLVNNHGVYFTW